MCPTGRGLVMDIAEVTDRAEAQRRTAKISVVIPCYNAISTLPACLASLAEQSLPAHEIIVVDDCSSEDLEIAVRKFGGVVFKRLARRTGAAGARSAGVEIATGDFVAFIDSDCTAPQNWLANIVELFDRNPELGAIGGGYRHGSTRSITAHLSRLDDEYTNFRSALTPDDVTLAGGNMAVRREAWALRSARDEIYLQGLASGEDTVLCSDLRWVTKVRFIPELTINHLPREGKGYFRRHRNRGFSGMTIILEGLQSNGISSFEFFGGKSLHFSTLFLMLGMVGFAAALVAVTMGALTTALLFAGGAVATAMVHVRLSSAWFRFASDADARFAPAERISFPQRVAIRGALAWRTVSWGWGALRGLGHYAAARLSRYWNLTCSVAHFWWPGRISKLFYFVTSQCNARCAFCFNLENVVNWSKRKPTELTLDEVEKLARRLGRLPYLTLSGGEPFARRDLPQVIHAFYQYAHTQWVTIPSNGALTKHVINGAREMMATCPKLILTLQFSLDSLFEDHDASRKIAGGFQDLTRTIQQVSQLRRHYKRRLRVHIATCYDDFNVHRIDEILSFCKANFDYDQHLFYLIRDGEQLFTAKNEHLVKGYIRLLQNNEPVEWREHSRSAGTHLR
jgi:glycosyltransferase involved in cell wall biosynthesis/organic radical activating enzyme